MFRKTLLSVFVCTVFMAPVTGSADALILDGIDQTNNARRPSRGMGMETVTSTWGQPVATKNAVGEPPITRWDYSGFIVYFEYGHVIHTVAKR